MKEYLEEKEAVLRAMQSSPDGLSDAEAAVRLQKNGANHLAEGKKESSLHRFFRQLTEPMTVVLLVAAAISGAVAYRAGEFPSDVLIILAVVLLNALLGVLQESKAEQAIAALQKSAAATSKVLRGGRRMSIRSEALVVGDIVLLEAGDVVPADARLLECAGLKTEEAALTGESLPVLKTAEALSAGEEGDIPLGDRTNTVFMGSTVVYGRGTALVCATGMATEMGKIAGALSAAKEGKTPLQKKLGELSRILTFLVIGICTLIFAVNLIRALADGSLSGERLIGAFMVAVSLAVAAIPEGLATVVTIVLSLGVTRMSKRNAIIRKLTAVETLGCTQVICSDKTGTLTQNKMRVVESFGSDERLLATALSLCSDAEPDAETGDVVGEPTECALVRYAASLSLEKRRQKEEFPRIGEVPFDSSRKMMTTVHRCLDGGIFQFTKGAPDELLKRCVTVWEDGAAVPLDDAHREAILEKGRQMAGRALRVLAAAMRRHDDAPARYDAESLEESLCFVGLVGMIDPIRPEVKDAIEECRAAGIRPIMITGDHKDTAVAIARELGILSDESEAITGAELDRISEAAFADSVTRYSVYARVRPEHKTRIVRAWRARGKITAMTGDGVNDAPSIKSADIGIGMGITGTDVTKNVADLILADDNFATIVDAVGEGRRIYDNIRKAIQFLLSSNLAEVLSIFVATLLGFSLFQPVHLLWINLITDCLPALSLGMEQAERSVMKRAPRSADEGVFAGGVGVSVAYQGALIAALTLLSYFLGCRIGALGTSMAFLTLSLAEIFHSFNLRSLRESVFRLPTQNRFLWGAGALSALLSAIVVSVPTIASVFDLTPLRPREFLLAAFLAFLVLPIVELLKFIARLLRRRT